MLKNRHAIISQAWRFFTLVGLHINRIIRKISINAVRGGVAFTDYRHPRTENPPYLVVDLCEKFFVFYEKISFFSLSTGGI